MTGVQINFPVGSPPVFDYTTVATGFNTTIQNALVCLGTALGSDQIFTSRGTSLLADANQGGLTDINAANQAASFAASEVLIFTQQYDDPTNVYRLTDFELTALALQNQQLTATILASDANGDTIGTTTAIST
jgi:hypothetical protein